MAKSDIVSVIAIKIDDRMVNIPHTLFDTFFNNEDKMVCIKPKSIDFHLSSALQSWKDNRSLLLLDALLFGAVSSEALDLVRIVVGKVVSGSEVL